MSEPTERKETLTMAKKAEPAEQRAERVILLLAGESGTGKSFFVAQLTNALIFDTDIGGGLAYLDERIRNNGSERIEVGSYLDVIAELERRRSHLGNITTLAIDHLTTLQQEAVLRHNPKLLDGTFGREHDKANREWRKVREYVRLGDFNLVCTAHLKQKYEQNKPVGMTTDASKNVEADFTMALRLERTGGYPALARVTKWRRDPDDARGRIPETFPLTLGGFLEIHGADMSGKRHVIPMATEEQVKEMEHLLGVVKLPEGLVDRWIAKAKAESWADFTEADLAKCIKYLHDTLKGQNGKSKGREPGVEEEVTA